MTSIYRQTEMCSARLDRRQRSGQVQHRQLQSQKRWVRPDLSLVNSLMPFAAWLLLSKMSQAPCRDRLDLGNLLRICCAVDIVSTSAVLLTLIRPSSISRQRHRSHLRAARIGCVPLPGSQLWASHRNEFLLRAHLRNAIVSQQQAVVATTTDGNDVLCDQPESKSRLSSCQSASLQRKLGLLHGKPSRDPAGKAY